MPTTSPDSIYYQDTATQHGEATTSAAMASSVQNALSARQQYTYRWADSTARGAQTGMRQGDTGYQIDTKSAYIYDSGVWRLQLSYAEFSAGSQSVTIANYTTFTGMSLNTGKTTDSNFVNTSGTFLTLVNPGIYSFSAYVVSSSFIAAANNSYIQIGETSNPNVSQLGRTYWPTGTSTASVGLPFYYSSAANQTIYFWFWFGSGTTPSPVPISSITVRVGRLG